MIHTFHDKTIEADSLLCRESRTPCEELNSNQSGVCWVQGRLEAVLNGGIRRHFLLVFI